MTIDFGSIAFIGAGRMASAIAIGLIRAKFDPGKIVAYDISADAAMNFSRTTGARNAASMPEAVEHAELVILAVKPQYATEALAEAKPFLKGKFLLSIAAGLTLDFLAHASGLERIVRVMPNTPALVGEGMSAYAGAPGIAQSDLDKVHAVLECIGRARRVSEAQLDAVTGLSGSGPAFVLEFIMALADGGVYAGLPRDMALEMAAQTVFGTAAMCLRTDTAPAELRDSVISPAGTTARGIRVLQNASFKGATANAVIAAAERSAELGENGILR